MFNGWPPPIFDPAGPYAWSVTVLAWVLLAMAAGVFALVVAALWVALFGRERTRRRLGGSKTIWLAGVALPVVVLSALLVYGLSLTSHLSDRIRGDELRVRITGEMWWWRVAYLGEDGNPEHHDANELHIPVGQPVVLELQSNDVIHSFWVPRLSGKLDMIPGRRNLMRIQADAPGVYGGQCAEFCGGPHALMGFVVVAHAPQDFARWSNARSLRERAAGQPNTGRGPALFKSAGCAACHRIAGSDANGLAGPDLTFMGTRRSVGAGILPNHRGTVMGWIANSQAIKPHNRMPPYPGLTGEDVRDLAIYLEAQR